MPITLYLVSIFTHNLPVYFVKAQNFFIKILRDRVFEFRSKFAKPKLGEISILNSLRLADSGEELIVYDMRCDSVYLTKHLAVVYPHFKNYLHEHEIKVDCVFFDKARNLIR